MDATTNAPDPKLIDFAQVFAGIVYPTDSVTVIVDEKLGYEAFRLQKEISEAAIKNQPEKRKELEAEFEKVAQDSAGATYTFHLTAISREVKDALRDKISAEFEVKTDVFGRMIPNPEAELAYKSQRWALHTQKITGPQGSTVEGPTPENLASFLQVAPDRAIADIDTKITELSGDGASVGFDALIRDADFLS